MFAYFSLLVEIGTFDIIEVNFLIVGHTHCSIDQYFSILSRGIRRCEFIESPIALWNLYQGVHKNPKRRPSVNRQIDTIFDMKAALQPYLNPCKNFQVPHCFLFRSKFSKCILQYKLFSFHEVYLPIEPAVTINDGVAHLQPLSGPQVNEIQLDPFALVGSRAEFVDHMGLSKTTALHALENRVCYAAFFLNLFNLKFIFVI